MLPLLQRINPFKQIGLSYTHMNQCELTEARNARIREVRIWQAVQELSIYILFVILLFYITYSNIGISAFDYQRSMKQIFASDQVVACKLGLPWLTHARFSPT